MWLVRLLLQIPRTPSWSLKELHHEGDIDASASVLTEDKVRSCPLQCAAVDRATWTDSHALYVHATTQLRELAELCHLHIDDAKLPSLLKDVESIIQCTKTIQAMTLDADIDELYANGDNDLGTCVLAAD